MQKAIKEQIFDKLDEIEALLKQATCDGEAFENNLGDYDDWAAELSAERGCLLVLGVECTYTRVELDCD